MMCWRVRPSQSSFDALRDEGPLQQGPGASVGVEQPRIVAGHERADRR